MLLVHPAFRSFQCISSLTIQTPKKKKGVTTKIKSKEKDAAAGYNCSSRTHSHHSHHTAAAALQNAFIFVFFFFPHPTPALSQAPSQFCAGLFPLPLNDDRGEGKLRLLLFDPQRAYPPGLARPSDS